MLVRQRRHCTNASMSTELTSDTKRKRKKEKKKRTSDKKQSLAEHFTEHSIEYIMIIEQVDDLKTLSERERYWINELGTKAHGLNLR